MLRLIAEGKTTKAIARLLGVSVKTVEFHLTKIYTKLGVTNRASAALRAMEYHLVG